MGHYAGEMGEDETEAQRESNEKVRRAQKDRQWKNDKDIFNTLIEKYAKEKTPPLEAGDRVKLRPEFCNYYN